MQQRIANTTAEQGRADPIIQALTRMSSCWAGGAWPVGAGVRQPWSDQRQQAPSRPRGEGSSRKPRLGERRTEGRCSCRNRLLVPRLVVEYASCANPRGHGEEEDCRVWWSPAAEFSPCVRENDDERAGKAGPRLCTSPL
jgi:hypothetical protein